MRQGCGCKGNCDAIVKINMPKRREISFPFEWFIDHNSLIYMGPRQKDLTIA
jgi:hypothetical protein